MTARSWPRTTDLTCRLLNALVRARNTLGTWRLRQVLKGLWNTASALSVASAASASSAASAVT
jgi:hypothetical protein